MKEIIYIQSGTLANYTGTHFWNTQESYLSDGSEDSGLHNFDVSFREGLSLTGQASLLPRLLVFDRKANFGTLTETNALLGTNEDKFPDEDLPAIWNGDVIEHRQDPIPKSEYHNYLDKPDTGGAENEPEDVDGVNEVRYWSDFNRLYYIPRTVQKIPDPTDWERLEGNWNLGQELFSRYNEENTLMEGSLRLFLEECDSPQGLHIMNDTASFGGFMQSLLTSFHDEFAKFPCLVFPLLSNAGLRHTNVDNHQGTKKIVNDALYLRSLNEFASMSIPILSTQDWPSEAWSQHLTSNHNNIYHNSAILSAHIETVTLPLRLRETHDTLSSLSEQLMYRGTPFGELSGVFPITFTDNLGTHLANFSTYRLRPGRTKYQFTRRDVTRGFTSSGFLAYDSWSAGQSRIQDTFIPRVHAPSYPIPTSYPAFFKPADGLPSRHPGILTRPSTTPMFSSLSTSSSTGHLFSAYAMAIDRRLKRKAGVESLGIDDDDLKELVNDLWLLHDNFDIGDSIGISAADEAGFGEDEE